MGNVVIRKIEPQDRERVLAIATELWTEIHAEYEKVIGEELHEKFFSGWITRLSSDISVKMDTPDFCFVAEIDGVVGGFCSYRIAVESDARGKYGVVGYNGVSPAYKGRGIAGKLYDTVFECMRRAGCEYVKVHTGLDDGHAPARRAYEKAGFEVGLPSIEYFKKL